MALVSQAAYLESLGQFLRDRPQLQGKLQDTPASKSVTQQIQKLAEKLELDGQEVPFDDKEAKDTLLCFHESPLAKVFNHILQQRLQESGLEAKEAAIVTERVSRSTHRYLKEAVAEVRTGVIHPSWTRTEILLPTIVAG